MKRLPIFIVSLAALFNSLSGYCWGPTGHDVVAAIAENHLTEKTKERLAELLDGRSIVYYSSWMDSIQNSPYWEAGYNQTKTWHYANVDNGHTYQTMKKNDNGDVVVALERLTSELTNNYENLTDSVRSDYVKMIVHMVGDMHCPMHAGRLSDLGGNRTKVRWFSRNTNLHSVWDSKIVESARNWSYSEWRDQLDRTDAEFKATVMQGNFEQWFTETVAGAAKIYDYVESMGENPNLSYQFVYDFSPLLEDRMLVGGYRLAYVLNSIFDPESVQPIK
ncbi:MAG: S1/P1 nuclease [Tidjanibacter sp.]|nr:S1/P1 nuclease [Tidjanibacter sp.]